MMKKSLVICGILLCLTIPLIAQGAEDREIGAEDREISATDFPDIPRITALDAYTKYKAGKAIIVQAGGQPFTRRHIVGAYDVNEDAVRKGKKELPDFPMQGIDILVYCY